MRTASDLLRIPWLTSRSSKILTVLAGRLPACHSLCQPDANQNNKYAISIKSKEYANQNTKYAVSIKRIRQCEFQCSILIYNIDLHPVSLSSIVFLNHFDYDYQNQFHQRGLIFWNNTRLYHLVIIRINLSQRDLVIVAVDFLQFAAHGIRS